jgi:hypothetical protein
MPWFSQWAMGIGRFAYTPLVPVMELDAGVSVSTAGAPHP